MILSMPKMNKNSPISMLKRRNEGYDIVGEILHGKNYIVG